MTEESASNHAEISRLRDLLFAAIFGVIFALKLNVIWGSGIVPQIPPQGLSVYLLYSLLFVLVYWLWAHRSEERGWLGILGAIDAIFAPFVAYGLAL